MRVLTLYSAPDCHLCEEALVRLRELQEELAFEVSVCDIHQDGALLRAYLERIPVGELEGEALFEFFVDEAALRERLESRR